MEINAVFEGGGVRGIALAGAAAGALDAGYTFHKTVGTSAGALVAALLAAGYNAKELEEQVAGMDWPGLLDPVPVTRIPIVGDHLALVLYRGVNRTKRIEAVWRKLLVRKGIRTFGDLPDGALEVVATDLTHGAGVAFPHCLPGYGIDPNTFSVARSLVMSAAVPFLFTPVTLFDTLEQEHVLFSDGAMAANYPIGVVSHDRPVFGFRLVPDGDPHVHQHISGPYSLARAVIVSGIRARYSLPRTIEGADLVIDVPVRSDLDFTLPSHEAHEVFTRARVSAKRQFELQ
ncbi:MAG: patatin-like phospholipase family protein, partial [Actinomycetia bacterium]|nr:patatin-like phospholipase family protein [Actinomycetes bacterium]